jgi:2,3-bisphosphoglycerate-dependent phosphoglycerate mutase
MQEYFLLIDYGQSSILSGKQVISLELSTGIPLLYIYKEGKFKKRGSPVGDTEAGVYAYTRV